MRPLKKLKVTETESSYAEYALLGRVEREREEDDVAVYPGEVAMNPLLCHEGGEGFTTERVFPPAK